MTRGPGNEAFCLYHALSADVAQLVEHFTRNEGVPGSSPGVGFNPSDVLQPSLEGPPGGL
jgi:hypothetical protein